MRVIHRETEEKALLRGHALEVVDLKFLPGQDVIATVANDGNVYVWRLSCVGSEIKCVPRPISTAPNPLQFALDLRFAVLGSALARGVTLGGD